MHPFVRYFDRRWLRSRLGRAPAQEAFPVNHAAGLGSPCPRCGKPMVPVVHGYPVPETFQAEARGELVIGGCRVPGEDSEMCIPCRDEAWERFEEFSPARYRAQTSDQV